MSCVLRIHPMPKSAIFELFYFFSVSVSVVYHQGHRAHFKTEGGDSC